MESRIWIGTSGWRYKGWKGPFYPKGMPESKFLPFYCDRFKTVEINQTFYGLPRETAVQKWRETVPADFIFAVKASRFITHMKKLKDPEFALENFTVRIKHLEEKLGPILFQLPPKWGYDRERFEYFLAALPKQYRYTFEFRNPDWFIPPVIEALQSTNIAFCMYDLAGRQSPRLVTADFVYIRLHGPGGAYQGSYSDEALTEWAFAIKTWNSEGKSVFCYFDNDQLGYAAQDALRMRAILNA